MATATTHVESFDDLYAEAYALIDQGICFDEVGHKDGAKVMYERGLALIDRAGQLPGSKQSEHYQKMVKARKYILDRLLDFSQGPAAPTELPEKPALYPEVPRASAYESISGALLAMGDVRQAEEIFCIPDGVQIFFIEGEDATVPSYPTCLKIFQFATEDGAHSAEYASGGAHGSAPAFLQVGDWVYPLMPGRSPALHSDYGAYLFPNPKGDDASSNVGVILPADLDRSLVEQFERLMKDFTDLRQESAPTPLTAPEKERLAQKLANMLVQGSVWLSGQIEKQTGKLNEEVRKRSETTKQSVKRCEKDIEINPRVQTSVHYLRAGTKVGVKVSGYLVKELGNAAVWLGKKVAKGALKVTGNPGKDGSESFVGDVIHVTGASVAGASTVFMSLENSARVLAKNLANETVGVVEYKYGEQAGKVTGDALHSTINAGVTAWNVSELGFKAIAKRTAKKTGLSMLEDLTAPSKAVKSAPEDPKTSPKK